MSTKFSLKHNDIVDTDMLYNKCVNMMCYFILTNLHIYAFLVS